MRRKYLIKITSSIGYLSNEFTLETDRRPSILKIRLFKACKTSLIPNVFKMALNICAMTRSFLILFFYFFQ